MLESPVCVEPLKERVAGMVADHLQSIEGRMKTLIEAITQDEAQCKARKDIVGRMIWDGWDFLLRRIEAQLEE